MCDLELQLHREAIRKDELPQIKYRVLEDHLGRRKTVHRIEITIMGQEFWLKGSVSNLRTALQFKTCLQIRRHLASGKLLNLEHWEPVVFINSYY